MTRARRLRDLTVGTGSLAAALAACVLPDREINIVDEDIQNKHAVRIIEPTQLSTEAEDACDAALAALKVPLDCQLGDPTTVLPHFLDPTSKDPKDPAKSYNFCSCPPGMKSSVLLPSSTLYVEDRPDAADQDVELFAAALLDPRADSKEPHRAVRYTDFISPEDPLLEVSDLEYQPLKRPKPQVRTLIVGGEPDIDPCNDANDTPLTRGFHTLRLMVTDRPWYRTDPDDTDGQAGVPDIAAGATFDETTYVFHCDDQTDAHCLTECAAPGEGP